MKSKLPVLLFWIVYIVGNIAIRYHYQGSKMHFWVVLFFYIINSLLVYFAATRVIPALLKRKSVTKFIVLLILCDIGYVLLNYLNENIFEVWYYNMKFDNELRVSDLFVVSLPFFLTYFSFGLGFYYFQESLQNEIALQKEKAEASEAKAAALEAIAKSSEAKAKQLQVEAVNLELEKEKLQLENDFRRAQINPHFLSNMLNTISSAIITKDPNAVDYVGYLGHIMQYSMSEPAPDGKVALAQEVNAIDMLLQLVQRRNMATYNLRFEKKGNIGHQRIIAHVLMTLVENCIKYGHVAEPDKPATISLTVEGSGLTFRVKNHILHNVNRHTNGVGLHNLRRRLELVYGNSFTYNIQNDGTVYEAELVLTL